VKAIDQSPEHGFEQVGSPQSLRRKLSSSPASGLNPRRPSCRSHSGKQLLQQGRQIGSRQGLAGAGRRWQFGGMEDSAEARRSVHCIAVDLLEPVAHHGRQVGAAQQGADQGPDVANGVRTSWVRASSRASFAVGWMRRLLVPLAGAAWTTGWQGDARRH